MSVTRVKGEVRGHDGHDGHRRKHRDRHDKKSWSRKSSEDC
jgi:hypothetical protein